MGKRKDEPFETRKCAPGHFFIFLTTTTYFTYAQRMKVNHHIICTWNVIKTCLWKKKKKKIMPTEFTNPDTKLGHRPDSQVWPFYFLLFSFVIDVAANTRNKKHKAERKRQRQLLDCTSRMVDRRLDVMTRLWILYVLREKRFSSFRLTKRSITFQWEINDFVSYSR